jgi:Flp pilus assembly protein TadB
MLNNSFPNDPKSIWQNQPTEPFKMTVRMIRRRTQQLRTKTRRELLNSMVVSLFVVGLSIFGITRVHGAALRGIFVLTIGWTLAAQYFVYRGSLADSKQSDFSLNTSLQSYRREVERQRDLSSSFLVWTFGPIVLVGSSMSALLFAVVRPHGFLLNTIPFFILLGSWFIVFVIRMQEQRHLQREIRELNEIERSNNS